MSWPSDPSSAPRSLVGRSGLVKVVTRGPLPKPGVAIVYATRTGAAVILSQRPSMRDIRKYRTWHEVDITWHQCTIQAKVRSQIDSMLFFLQAEAIWGVSDPARIVQHGTTDGESLVRSEIVDQAWQITRDFDIEQVGIAEEKLQKRFEAGPMILETGITVYRVIVKLHSDNPTAQYNALKRHLKRSGVTDQEAFKNRSNQEQWNADLERDRIAALKRVAAGEDDLLFLFLARHPEEVGSVIEQVGKRRELNLNAQMSLFDKMVDKGFIQEADVESMRRLLLRPMEEVADSGSSSMLHKAAPQQALQQGQAAVVPEAPKPPPATQALAPQAPVTQKSESDGVVGWVKFGRAADDADDS